MKHTIAVVGVGTEVGKTHVSCALLLAMRSRGLTCTGLKPIESGVPEPVLREMGVADGPVRWARASDTPTRATPTPQHSKEGEGVAVPKPALPTVDLPALQTEVDAAPTDAARLAACSTFHVKHPYLAFAEPVSPHLAARRCGLDIKVADACAWTCRHAVGHRVVETAGGLLSPLAPGATNLTLVLALKPSQILLVAADRLGVLHDVSATMYVLEQHGLAERTQLALSAGNKPDASSGSNAEELRRLQVHPKPVTFPRAPISDSHTQEAASVLLRLILASPAPDR